MPAAVLIAQLESMGSPHNVAGMARFGITPAHALGISVTELRKIARTAGRDHELAAELWASGIHEARLLASMVDEPDRVTQRQMNQWVKDFDTWDICDQTCLNLFVRTPFVDVKAYEWVKRNEEFVRRAGFVLMATAAVHDKKAPDSRFIDFVPTLVEGMTDERNYVKKSVSWSFRQIGKRNLALHEVVSETVAPLVDSPNRTTRWIARDVVRDLATRIPSA